MGGMNMDTPLLVVGAARDQSSFFFLWMTTARAIVVDTSYTFL